MLLLDTSLMGQMVQPVAESLIRQLQPKEQMAVVAYHSSADLIQDFTSSRQLLSRAVAEGEIRQHAARAGCSLRVDRRRFPGQQFPAGHSAGDGRRGRTTAA